MSKQSNEKTRYEKEVVKYERKKKIGKIRASIVFGILGLTLAAAILVVLIATIIKMVTPFSYPESVLSKVQDTNRYVSTDYLNTPVQIPGQAYHIQFPAGEMSGSNEYLAVKEGKYTFVTYITDKKLPDLLNGDLSGLGAAFYQSGDKVTYTPAITDTGYLNSYEWTYYTGNAVVTFMANETTVYSAAYSMEVDSGNIILAVLVTDKSALKSAKNYLDAQVFTIIKGDEIINPNSDNISASDGATTEGASDLATSESVEDSSNLDDIVNNDNLSEGEKIDAIRQDAIEGDDSSYNPISSISFPIEEDPGKIYVQLFHANSNAKINEIYITCWDMDSELFGVKIYPEEKVTPCYYDFIIENYDGGWHEWSVYVDADESIGKYSISTCNEQIHDFGYYTDPDTGEPNVIHPED